MNTAIEIQMKHEEALPVIRQISNHFAATTIEGALYLMAGREVCARRARIIRKRGDHVRYVGDTTTGKARYRWLPNIRIERA